jgi:ribose transport system ATP-binding protein
MRMEPLLTMRGIVKRYPGVLALDHVDFTLLPGEVHCLVGENGAGKSTLMKVLAGALRKDEGEIRIEGHEVEILSPLEAQKLGIGIIYQDFKLVPGLSVAENIMLGNEPTVGPTPFLDRHAMKEAAMASLAQLGESIDTAALISDLSVAKKQMVEIAKALSRRVRMLAMDEPTAPLTDHETAILFNVIRRLKAEGVGIIYISHRLEEVFAIGDRVTVLRDGKAVNSAPLKDVDRRTLIRWMVGRDLENEYPKAQLQRGEALLQLEHINGGRLRDIGLTLYRGEVLGLAGLVGAGRTELARVLFGADPKTGGRIVLEGREVAPRTPHDAIACGIGLLTEDRNQYGLVMQMNIRENISLSNLRDVMSGPFVDRSKERAVARRFADDLRIKTPDLEASVDTLSGGNRQKVILARWLNTRAKVLIFDEPTAGIDVGVKYEIYLLINRLAQDGIGVVVISSDLPELLGICDRIAVMCEGAVTGVLERHEATQEKVMELATRFSATVRSAP